MEFEKSAFETLERIFCSSSICRRLIGGEAFDRIHARIRARGEPQLTPAHHYFIRVSPSPPLTFENA